MPLFAALAPATGLCFLGRAANVDRRLRVLRAASPAELHLWKIFTGGPRELLELRLRFRAHAHHAGWYVAAPLAAALEALTKIELVAVANRCPRCGKPRDEGRPRADHRGRYCISCSQRKRWAKLSTEERATAVEPMLTSPRRKKAHLRRVAKFAAVRRKNAKCVDCGTRLPVQPSSKVAAGAQRRCRSCGMRAKWRDPRYQRARAAGLARRKAGR